MAEKEPSADYLAKLAKQASKAGKSGVLDYLAHDKELPADERKIYARMMINKELNKLDAWVKWVIAIEAIAILILYTVTILYASGAI